MTKKVEELILEQVFKLSEKIDKMQEKMNNFITKEDAKNFATKDDLKCFVTNEYLEQRLNKQTEEIAEVFHNSFETSTRIHQEMEERFDKKIQALRNEFITYQKSKPRRMI
ncbi:MAG: hypothetical protein IKF38_06200 [Clostridia bacterium]|nr:hypothetical protein [Clostridia bacterium]